MAINVNAVLNDPTMTPLITQQDRVLVTHHDTVLIVRSSLRVRFASTEYGKKGGWLRTPRTYVRGGAR